MERLSKNSCYTARKTAEAILNPCSFASKTLYFSSEEWNLLDKAQRCLHQDVRDKGESGVMDTLLSCWCKQLGGVVPVPEAGGTGGEADLGAC